MFARRDSSEAPIKFLMTTIYAHSNGISLALALHWSKGYVVVVLEHNDGSASSCLFPDGRETEYKPPPNLRDVTSIENRVFR